MKTNLQIALDAFQEIEQNLVRIKRALWVGGMFAVGTAPIFLYMSADLPTPPLRQSAIYFLLVLSSYLMYGSFTYRKLVYLNRYIRLEQRFLHHHQAEDGLWQTLGNPEHLWSPSYTFQFLRAELQRYLPDNSAATKSPDKWWRLQRRKTPHPLLPTEHFDQTLGQLCLPWINLSLAFWASMVWIMYRTPARIPDLIWQNYAGWFAASVLVLVLALGFEVWGIYNRIRLYRSFPLLQKGMTSFAMDVLQTVPNLLPDWSSPIDQLEDKKEVEVLHLQHIGKTKISVPTRRSKPEHRQLRVVSAEKKVPVATPQPEEVPNLFIPLDVLLTLPTAEVSLEPEPNSLSEHFTLSVTPEKTLPSVPEAEPDTEVQHWVFEMDEEPDTMTDDWLPVPVFGGKPMPIPQAVAEEWPRIPERHWGDSLSTKKPILPHEASNPKEVLFIGKLSANAAGQAVITMQPISQGDHLANPPSLLPEIEPDPERQLPSFSSLADLV
ncbi:MAG: hypothetical protein JNN12_15780 [Bacteroidetes Order II. Incertae sedis bacterium]|nr:hypothetical protein [Bacteroidetes Order II. bacterium]